MMRLLMDSALMAVEARTPILTRLRRVGAMFPAIPYNRRSVADARHAADCMDNHRTGVCHHSEGVGQRRHCRPGLDYTMAFEPGVSFTLADRLGAAGLFATIDEWRNGHLGRQIRRNAERHWLPALVLPWRRRGADNWDDKVPQPFMPTAPWFENGVEASLPKRFLFLSLHRRQD